MKLYGSYTSPFVRHCRIVLLETQQDCEFIETDQHASAAQSPTQRVPFFKDGDLFLTDSTAIIKYLREKAGQDFCASAQESNDYCMATTALDSTVNLFFLERDGVKITDIPYLQRQAARIASTLTELNALALPGHPPYTDAHLRLACFIGWAKFRKRLDFSSFAHLEEFFTAMGHYEPFNATVPPQ